MENFYASREEINLNIFCVGCLYYNTTAKKNWWARVSYRTHFQYRLRLRRADAIAKLGV